MRLGKPGLFLHLDMIVKPEELQANCMKFFKNDALATQVWMSKYAKRNLAGDFVEASPEERLKEIAFEIYLAGCKYNDDFELTQQEIEDYLMSLTILPGGSGLYGIGNEYSVSTLGNCFVVSLNNEDSYGSILKVDEEIVQIAKRRGGIGVDISCLRPSGASVSNSAGSSTGAVSFVQRYSNTTREVAQSGRRGALMISISVNHPDIMDFINLKLDKTKATGANLSIRVTDEFMRAVEADGDFVLRYPVDIPAKPRYEVTNQAEVRRTVKARTIWDAMMKAAHDCAEPGILYWDTITRESPADCYPEFKTEGTNPCSEIPLSPYDSCRLLSVVLPKHVLNPYTPDATFDTQAFKKSAAAATIMMDNIIDLEIEKIDRIIAKIQSDPEMYETKRRELQLWKNIRRTTVNGRRAGISAIGYGDTLAMLGLKYGTDEANNFAETIQHVFARAVYCTDASLAITRGAFPAFNEYSFSQSEFIKRVLPEDVYESCRVFGLRNIALLTEPPAGTLSIIAGNITSGIEPVFMPVYYRKRKTTKTDPNATFTDITGDKFIEYPVIHPGVLNWIRVAHPEIYIETLTKQRLSELISESPYAGCSANEIDPLSKIEFQGMLQQWIDHSISVTHNLPKDVSIKTVSDIYMAAWKSGCKGCTIYRDGSRDGILTSETTETTGKTHKYYNSIKRPKNVPCDILYPTINGKKFIIMVGFVDGVPFEVFARAKGDHDITNTTGILSRKKSGYYNLLDNDKKLLIDNVGQNLETPDWEVTTRLLSWGMRHGGDITYAVEQMQEAPGNIMDVTKVLARTLKKYANPTTKTRICPECGGEMKVEGGCSLCKDCGFSKCS